MRSCSAASRCAAATYASCKCLANVYESISHLRSIDTSGSHGRQHLAPTFVSDRERERERDPASSKRDRMRTCTQQGLIVSCTKQARHDDELQLSVFGSPGFHRSYDVLVRARWILNRVLITLTLPCSKRMMRWLVRSIAAGWPTDNGLLSNCCNLLL